MFMCATMPVSAIGAFCPRYLSAAVSHRVTIGYFVTIILGTLGWGVRDSLLLTAPVYVFAVRTFELYVFPVRATDPLPLGPLLFRIRLDLRSHKEARVTDSHSNIIYHRWSVDHRIRKTGRRSIFRYAHSIPL